MKYFAPYIRKIDVFSVPFTPSIDLKSKEVYYSSLIGGLCTIAIHAFVLFYGITLLNKWFNYEMLYKISSQQQNQDSELFQDYFNTHNNSEQLIFEIAWNSQEEETIYPFQKNNSIVLPLLYNCYENKTLNLLQFYNDTSQQIVLDFNSNDTHYCYYLIILPCVNNSQFLDSGQQCASQEDSYNFFQKDGIEFDISVTTYGINFENNEISSNSIYTINFISNELSTLKSLNIQHSYYELISGFFSENKERYLLRTDFSSRDQVGTQDYITKYCRYFRPEFQNVYGAVSISANTMINYIVVQYPSLGEVLASIGSIAQTLLLIRFFLEYFNRFWMNDEFKAFFINIFFPDLVNVKKKRNWFKTDYYYGEKKLNTKSFLSLQKTLNEQIEQKMNYSNLIYEVTKMQSVIDDMSSQYQILQSHFKKIELDLIYCEKSNEYLVLDYWNKKLENIEEQKKITFYPFSFNFSLRQLSELYCKNFSSDVELISSKRNKPEIMINSQLFENEQKF